jgi:hypothetical protein
MEETLREIIWSFLVDPEKIPMWFDTFKKCEYTSGKHTGVGTTYYVEEKVPGPIRKVNFKATTWDENENLTLKMTSGKNVTSYEIRWHLIAETSGTELFFRLTSLIKLLCGLDLLLPT